MKRYYTFMYVRPGNTGVRTIRVRRSIALALLVCFAGLVLSAAGVLLSHSGELARSVSLKRLERENEALTSRVNRYRGDIEQLRDRMAVSFDLQNRARLLASLDPISSDVWKVGVGGPEPAPGLLETAYPESLWSSLDESLSAMIRQSELQLESSREVLNVLERERDVRESTPTLRPLKSGFLSSRFGPRMDPFLGEVVRHSGVDYRARTGTPVMSTAAGIVAFAGRNGGFGYMVEIDHGNGFRTKYAHLSKALVHRGQKVKRGEIVGLVGNTGHSTGSHLHYEVLFRKVHRDPLQYVIPDGTSYD